MNKHIDITGNSKGKASQKPKICTSKLGYQFLVEDQEWRLNNLIVIKWQNVPEFPGSEKILNGFRNTLANYGEQVSPDHTNNMFSRMCGLMSFCTGVVTVKAINEWRESLGDERLWYLGSLRGFLLQWADWGFSGIDPKLPDFLDSLTLPGNEKGRAVRISCPHTGPFDRQEYQALGRWVQSAWRNEEISLSDCSLLRLFMETGRRPSEIAALRIGDLRVKTLAGGSHVLSKDSYRLVVPRAKRRGKHAWRDLDTADELPISDDLFDLLHNLGQQVIRSLERLWRVKLPSATSKELPLFVSAGLALFTEVGSPEEFHAVEARTPDFFHDNRAGLNSRLKAIGKACKAVSARTNDHMLLSAYRFRRTLGTVLAKHGYNAYEIAAALGHDDTQNVQVYTENSAEAFDRFEEIMEPAFAPLLKAFTGEIIRSNQPGYERQPYVHVLAGYDAPFESGKCGSFALCHRGWYICYTCVKFSAFVDADHERALKEVEAEYERTKAQGYQDSMLTGLDATMDAIKEVIRLCKKMREEEARV